jgi:hypothetical protein
MKAVKKTKKWVKPFLIKYGSIAELTQGGTGWKTNGIGDDLLEDQLPPFCSSCCK